MTSRLERRGAGITWCALKPATFGRFIERSKPATPFGSFRNSIQYCSNGCQDRLTICFAWPSRSLTFFGVRSSTESNWLLGLKLFLCLAFSVSNLLPNGATRRRLAVGERVLWQLGNRKRELTAIAARRKEWNAGSSSWCGVPICIGLMSYVVRPLSNELAAMSHRRVGENRGKMPSRPTESKFY